MSNISAEEIEAKYSKYNTIEDDFELQKLKDMNVYVKYHPKFTPTEDDLMELDIDKSWKDKQKEKQKWEKLILNQWIQIAMQILL